MPFPHEAILGLDFFSALVDAFLQITRGRRPLVIWGNASTCAEKKSTPRIASRGGGTGGAQGARAPPVFWEKELKNCQ